MKSEETRILSIDLDDVAVAFADFTRKPLPQSYRNTAARDTAATLEVLDRAGARATFFVNTQLAVPDEAWLADIVAAGHDLASHGFHHYDLRTRTLDQFRDDLRRSLDILSRYQTGIIGYRPPSFTMPFEDEYFRVLLDNGIRYISSGVGVARSNAPFSPDPVTLECGLVQVPISLQPVLGGLVKYPIGYGVASRLLPEAVYLATLKNWLARRDYLHYYTHTFEIAGVGPDVPFSVRWSHTTRGIYCLRCWKRESFFEKIFRSCRFRSIEELFRQVTGSDS